MTVLLPLPLPLSGARVGVSVRQAPCFATSIGARPFCAGFRIDQDRAGPAKLCSPPAAWQYHIPTCGKGVQNIRGHAIFDGQAAIRKPAQPRRWMLQGSPWGGDGMVELAKAVARSANAPAAVKYAYPLDASAEEKVLALARSIYNADDVSWSADARRSLRYCESQGWGNLPICMAKTHLSISHDPNLKGAPSGYTFPIVDIRASVGAGFLYTLAGRIETLPGLPSRPRALEMDVSNDGQIVGL